MIRISSDLKRRFAHQISSFCTNSTQQSRQIMIITVCSLDDFFLPGQIYCNDAIIMMTVVLGIIASLLLFAIVAIIMIIAVSIFLICNQCLQGALGKMFAKNTQQLLDCAQVMQNMFCVCRSKNTKKHLLSLKNIQQVLSPLMIVKVHSPQLQPLVALFANEPPTKIGQHFEVGNTLYRPAIIESL